MIFYNLSFCDCHKITLQRSTFHSCNIWRHPKDVVRILKIARRLEVGNLNDDFFSQLSAIFLLNISKISEEDILNIIESFQQLKYLDSNIVRALESLFSTGLCQDADMVSTVCTYCTTMRIRLPPMLNTVRQDKFTSSKLIFLSQ